jgi:lysophospholipase L1-like esterase
MPIRFTSYVARLVVVVSVAVGAVVVPTQVAGAHPREQRVDYIALGDSVAFGYSPFLTDPWVPNRFVGYPELLARQTHLKTANLACPGQTAQALISLQAPDAGCFDGRANAEANDFPFLHVDYQGTQLDAALARIGRDQSPKLITIQGGGNELLLCLRSPDPTACMDGARPKIAAALISAVKSLRRAGYGGPLALLGYYPIPGIETIEGTLEATIRDAARRTSVRFGNVAKVFASYANRHGGDICTTGLLISFGDGNCDVHPTRAGQQLIAQLVQRILDGHDDDNQTRAR